MDKKIYESKTIQGIVVAAIGALLLTFGTGSTEVAYTIVTAGLSYAGIGMRLASK